MPPSAYFPKRDIGYRGNEPFVNGDSHTTLIHQCMQYATSFPTISMIDHKHFKFCRVKSILFIINIYYPPCVVMQSNRFAINYAVGSERNVTSHTSATLLIRTHLACAQMRAGAGKCKCNTVQCSA